MGIMKNISIESQNNFEGKIFCILDNIESEIEDLVNSNEENAIKQEGLIDAIMRLYYIYQLIQIDLW